MLSPQILKYLVQFSSSRTGLTYEISLTGVSYIMKVVASIFAAVAASMACTQAALGSSPIVVPSNHGSAAPWNVASRVYAGSQGGVVLTQPNSSVPNSCPLWTYDDQFTTANNLVLDTECLSTGFAPLRSGGLAVYKTSLMAWSQSGNDASLKWSKQWTDKTSAGNPEILHVQDSVVVAGLLKNGSTTYCGLAGFNLDGEVVWRADTKFVPSVQVNRTEVITGCGALGAAPGINGSFGIGYQYDGGMVVTWRSAGSGALLYKPTLIPKGSIAAGWSLASKSCMLGSNQQGYAELACVDTSRSYFTPPLCTTSGSTNCPASPSTVNTNPWDDGGIGLNGAVPDTNAVIYQFGVVLRVNHDSATLLATNVTDCITDTHVGLAIATMQGGATGYVDGQVYWKTQEQLRLNFLAALAGKQLIGIAITKEPTNAKAGAAMVMSWDAPTLPSPSPSPQASPSVSPSASASAAPGSDKHHNKGLTPAEYVGIGAGVLVAIVVAGIIWKRMSRRRTSDNEGMYRAME